MLGELCPDAQKEKTQCQKRQSGCNIIFFPPSILIYFPRGDIKYYMEIMFITVKTIRPISLMKKRNFKVCGKTFR